MKFFPAAITDNFHRKFVFQGNAYCSLQVFCFLAQFFRTDPARYYEFENRFPYGFPLFGQVPEHMLEQKRHCSVNSQAPAAAGCNLQNLDNPFPAPVRNLDLLKLKVLSKFRDYYLNIRVNRKDFAFFRSFSIFRNRNALRGFEIIRAPEKKISEIFIILDI